MSEDLVSRSGCIVAHSVIATSPGSAVVTMIGAATGDTLPGGIVEIDDSTGALKRRVGPGPVREADEAGPRHMYAFYTLDETSRGIRTTFGHPHCARRASPRAAWATGPRCGICSNRR